MPDQGAASGLGKRTIQNDLVIKTKLGCFNEGSVRGVQPINNQKNGFGEMAS